MGIATVAQLAGLYGRQGIETVYLKWLSPKQDNEKNQIYLGGGLDSVMNLFPSTLAERSASMSTRKPASKAGTTKLEAKIDLEWMDTEGGVAKAPNARIIDYFQFPEVRLSGFLSGCSMAPDALRRSRQSLYGKRVLVLGTRSDGAVVGMIITERDDPLVSAMPELPELGAAPIFRVLTFAGRPGDTPLELLIADLRKVVSGGWHRSVILRPGNTGPVPFTGAQGGGYTLEALLGVSANAAKKPDLHGFEIKSYGGSRISLMTPVPNGGYQGKHSFRQFMERYGREGDKQDGSRRFTGLHRSGDTNSRTGLSLEVLGYDQGTDTFDSSPENIRVQLVDRKTDDVAASWSLTHLGNAWNAKHASAAYLPCAVRDHAEGYGKEYSYGDHVLIGEGTDVWRLLRAIASGHVFYDPADTIYGDNIAKVRPQWRANTSQLRDAMAILYRKTTETRLH